MSDLGNANWSEVDASNNATPPNGAPENMNPSSVDDTMRAMAGALKRWWDRSNVTATTGGTNTAYTLAYAVAAAAYYSGEVFFFTLNATCGVTPSLNINGLGAYNFRKFVSGAWATLAAGDLLANQVVGVYCNTGASTFDIIDPLFGYVTLSGNNTYTGAQTYQAASNMSGAAFNDASATLASASTVNIGAAAGNYLIITGTTTITAFDTVQAGTERLIKFSGAVTLTHNGTTLILPGAGNITTAAGDCAIFESEGAGNWRCVSYMKADGTPLVATSYAGQVRAWANFNSSASVAASGNVSGVVRNSAGNFTISFTNNISSNASFALSYLDTTNSGGMRVTAQSASAVTIQSFNTAGSPFDFTSYSISMIA